MNEIPRRAALFGGLALVAGCAVEQSVVVTSTGGTTTPAMTEPDALVALEAELGGRLGVYAIDTGTGRSAGHRADELFLSCSTHKPLVAANILHRAETESALLGQLIRYDRSRLLEYAPITGRHVDTGMTVADLCAAAVEVSDNTADNLLFDLVGGPAGVTAFVRSLGDTITRLDRVEPDLNVAAPGDERDTTTPTRITRTLGKLLLADGLTQPGKDRLIGWMVDSTTGKDLVRAALPTGWRTGDKSGSGAQGQVNNVAITWPPNGAPWLVAVFTAPNDHDGDRTRPFVARAAKIAVDALGAH
ncbi:class A beta-lactamase [Actinokineospora enzanensis]|uniref:class A beta-lactamase n=1 Tax=Actinokineospora enzanensis TaxID=155975 RepID=UPI000378E193|nr:class A beta-lactamase [Actinokineospora enzanensis]